MDLPVEATVRLDIFPDEDEVREILRSHGFVLTDQSRNGVRVKGSFFKLKAAKASLERLLPSKTKTDLTPGPTVSSGAISKYHATNGSPSDADRGGEKPLHGFSSPPSTSSYWASPNKHSTSPECRASLSSAADQRGSLRRGRESFVVNADVFCYAENLRNKDIEGILYVHNVIMEAHEVGDSFEITLLGRSARTAAGKLRSLMHDLNRSLRTQEVPLRDMDRDGRALLERIRKDRNIYNSVLVCPMDDKLHLIGSSGESYELKQRLLGRPAGRTGRTLDRNSKSRSSSLPPIRNTERDGGAIARPSPAGYSPTKYQDDKQEAAQRGATASFGHGGAARRRSQSDSRRAERVRVQEVENEHLPSKSPKKVLTQLLNLNTKDIKKRLKLGMHRNENSWPKPKTGNEETKAENRNTERNY